MAGDPFTYKGETIQVTPVPASRPHPPLFVGGMSKAAARRAARFGLPFFPPMKMPELESFYYQECERHGTSGFVLGFGKDSDQTNSMLFIDRDPEAAWRELGL